MEEVLILKTASDSSCSSQASSSRSSPDAQENLHSQSSSPEPSTMCVTTVPPPPPPPPPPLPPPPPPPPPLLAPSSFGSRGVQRRSMKKLNWDTIPSQRVLGKRNVWTTKGAQRELVLDIRSMEELFSHVDKRASIRNSRVMGLKNSDGLDLFPQEPQVTILDSKKSMNIGIFLRHFKRPVAEMVQDICHGNWLRFGTGKLKELCKLLPEDSEVKQLMSFSGNLSVLPEADQFMVQLVKVPGYEERLKAMVLREEFFPLMEEVKNSVAVMTKGANELLDCDDLHTVIRLVLKAGNYMNAGGYSANAIGFRMTSLLKLADTKANKPGMNLMHYVAKQAEDIDAELLTFPSQLQHIGMASRICKEEVISDYEREVKKIKEVKLYTSRHPALLQQMQTFFMRAETKLADVESFIQDLSVVSDHVAEYYCEDPATFKLGECCSIFHSFCQRFEAAVQENREREQAEERRKRRESVRVAAKRRSTVSCSRPEPNHDSSLESVLQNFLSTVPEGLSRCRKNTLPTIKGSPSLCSSKTVPPVEKTETLSGSAQDLSENKQPKLQEEQEPLLENKDEAEKMRKITRKVLHYQKSLDRDRVQGTPQQSKRAANTEASPSTPQQSERANNTEVLPRTPQQSERANNTEVSPRTPQQSEKANNTEASPRTPQQSERATNTEASPRTPQQSERATNTEASQRTPYPRVRDYFFANNPGSPWTILSPLTCPKENPTSQNRHPRRPSSLGGDDQDNLWVSNQGTSPSGGAASLPECPSKRATSRAPILRSVSVDEAKRSPTSLIRLGELFHRSISQRSHSSGSRTEIVKEAEEGDCLLLGRKSENHVEGREGTSGIRSFFRRIGGRSKPFDVDQQHFKGSYT
ncbi:FH2 domain containing 3 [Cheilinus undulatus]|uniref:FH2 domain containing 3 n=1 Tax=Cheilinus undulatus TaxID=241271 RepID=UPI001BD2DA00|nr:FH2 domain containing 3 [Cheilinus undulatus]